MSIHHSKRPHERGHHTSEFQVVGALLLIALGTVFLAQQAGYLSHSANWWVIFLAFPGVGLLWNAVSNSRRPERTPGAEVIEAVVGIGLLLLSVIFIFDPTWSFTRTWNLVFPNFDWDRLWPYFIVVPGILLLVAGIVRRRSGSIVIGAVVTIVGATFVFEIDWNYVWPLALIIPGVWLLYRSMRRSE